MRLKKGKIKLCNLSSTDESIGSDEIKKKLADASSQFNSTKKDGDN